MNPSKSTHVPHLNLETYKTMYKQSMENPNDFWDEQAKKFISWFRPWKTVMAGGFHALDLAWFTGGQLNACYNCIDRHLPARQDQVALIWEGNEPDTSKVFTYAQLHEAVCKFANVLKMKGVKKGDRVCIYLPMIPEAIISMLACARIGAIHVVVFAGFSPESLKGRILDADCSLLITADEGSRGEKRISLKSNSDAAIAGLKNLKHMIVVKHTGNEVPWDASRDSWYHESLTQVNADCPVAHMDSSDPLFILHTSGSTGKPKGVLHGTGGYLVYAAMTHHYVFDYHEGDVYWCTADVGWITGHTYTVYGPLANGATSVIFEGVPHYPTYARYWEIVDKHQVNIFYTAPTAIRAIRHEGDEPVKKQSRKSLKLLGTVGEPMNPEVWKWYFEVVGDKRCPIVDTWWQTETGGIMLSPLPGVSSFKPGSVGWPFFGVKAEILKDKGQPVKPGEAGHLVISKPWPGLMQTIYRNRKRFAETYFQKIAGCYFTGDAAQCDEAGYFTVIGRNDDVIKVSGHRIGTGELESALLTHHAVSEAGVVGVPHQITGEGIEAFITLNDSTNGTEALKKELIQHVRKQIGPIATIQSIQWASGLPKTRSGKIMRRILRKIAQGDYEDLGDLSTLSDATVVDELIRDARDIEVKRRAP
jgi:acetyl-CoA synthetase